MSLDLDRVTRAVEETAREEVLPRFRKLSDAERRMKEGGEVVTVADEAAERRLTARLRDLLPGSEVVGEEAASADPAVFGHLAGEGSVWLVDPIDGTANFADGIPIFAVMVALVRDGRTVASWIHDAPNGRTAVAEAGGGSWLDGGRLRAAAAAPLDRMTGTLLAGRHGGEALRQRIRALRERLGAVKSLRCAAAEYLRLATGEMHYSLFTRLMPWDHAAGVLLHAEAGGFSRTAEGRPYSPAERGGRGLLLAPDEAAWQALYEVLFEDVEPPIGPTAAGP